MQFTGLKAAGFPDIGLRRGVFVLAIWTDPHRVFTTLFHLIADRVTRDAPFLARRVWFTRRAGQPHVPKRRPFQELITTT